MAATRNPEDELAFVDNLVRTEGLRAAVECLIDLCRDKKAPAAARAVSANGLLRAHGFGGYGKNPDGEMGKELHEMTHEEVQVALRRMQRGNAQFDEADDDRSAFD